MPTRHSAISVLTFSTMTTALVPAGRGWPVLIQNASVPMVRRRGRRVEAVKVDSALTAMPSMAAPWKAGEERRAATGSASTRCRAADRGTRSVASSRPSALMRSSQPWRAASTVCKVR